MEKKYFSLPAAARELGVSTDVLRQQYRTGRIPAIKTPGGQPRFSAEALELIKQNGWPRPDHSEHETASIQTQTSYQTAIQDEFPEPRKHSFIDPDDLNFQPMQVREVRLSGELEQRPRTDLFSFHRKWIDYARRLLPFGLSAEQVADLSEQIAKEVKGRTPEEELWMRLACEQIVHLALLPLNRQREMTQAREAALHRILAKIPHDATENEKMRVQGLARDAMQQAGEQPDGEAFFLAAWQAVVPVFTAVEFRRERESLRAWAWQTLPPQANEKEQREARAAINRVIEHITDADDKSEVRDRLVEALEPILAAVAKGRDEERRRQRINGLLSLLSSHVGTYLYTLYNCGELDYEAIVDREWRQDLEGIVAAEAQKRLNGDETGEKLTKFVQDVLDHELEEADDDEGN